MTLIGAPAQTQALTPRIESLMTAAESSALFKWSKIAAERSKDGNPLACEIGSYRGYSTAIIAEHLPVWSIDLGGDLMSGTNHPETIGTEIRSSFIQNMVAKGLLPNQVFSVCATSDCLATLPVDLFDFVLVDADHSYEWCMKDLHNAASVMKPTGIMAIHDYKVGFPTCEGFGVTQAVDDFLLGDPEWIVLELVDTLMVIGLQRYHGRDSK